MTRPYAEVIGDPIRQSKSPLIHNFWLSKLGIDGEYRACNVRHDELASYFSERRTDPAWRGCNVTIPHKVDVLGFVDNADWSVTDVGAANCVVPREGNLIAFNTDVDGVEAAIRGDQNPVCMIGAGGAARAAISVLDVYASAYSLRIIARDKEKAAATFSGAYGIEFFAFGEAAQALNDVEAVINASPLGMVGQPPMPQSVLDAISLTDRHSTVFDMVYTPLETELIKTARANGRETVDGLVMLVGQARRAFEYFFGQYPDRTGKFDAELRRLLTP